MNIKKAIFKIFGTLKFLKDKFTQFKIDPSKLKNNNCNDIHKYYQSIKTLFIKKKDTDKSKFCLFIF